MKVFISWSGERSKAVGDLFCNWLSCVIQSIEPWISTRDIDRGAIWFSEINDILKDTSVGIICLTRENKEKPWILFEAGALVKGLSSNRVCTFLIDLNPSDIIDPLAQFNHTFPTKESVRGLIITLNNLLGEKALKESILANIFETYWPQFETKFSEILQNTNETTPIQRRDQNDILMEVLTITRNIEKATRFLEEKERRNELIKKLTELTLSNKTTSSETEKIRDQASLWDWHKKE